MPTPALSPEMLEALKRIVGKMPPEDEPWGDVEIAANDYGRAAIAKAEGASC